VNRIARYLLTIALCAAVLPTLSWSTQGNSGQLRKAKSDRGKNAQAHSEKWERDPVIFTTRDRNDIRRHYRATGLPPGLAKRNGNLPPGLRKQLQRNGTLPPGLQTRFEPLSADLEGSLRPLASGYSRGRIGQDVVILETRTQRVIDIIRNVTARL